MRYLNTALSTIGLWRKTHEQVILPALIHVEETILSKPSCLCHKFKGHSLYKDLKSLPIKKIGCFQSFVLGFNDISNDTMFLPHKIVSKKQKK